MYGTGEIADSIETVEIWTLGAFIHAETCGVISELGRLASSDTLSCHVISIQGGQTLIETAASGIVHVEIGGEIGSGWTASDAALILKVLILREAVLDTLHTGLEGVIICSANIHAYF